MRQEGEEGEEGEEEEEKEDEQEEKEREREPGEVIRSAMHKELNFIRQVHWSGGGITKRLEFSRARKWCQWRFAAKQRHSSLLLNSLLDKGSSHNATEVAVDV